jgi:hypothetical protein
MDNVCGYCMQLHVKGTPAWRDCRQKQFTALVADPTKWEFKPTPDQIDRVKRAVLHYQTEFRGIPNIQDIRSLIAQQFHQTDEDGPGLDVVAMTKFWQDFGIDMPEVMRSHSGIMNNLDMEWSQRKIFAILNEQKLPYIDWELDEIAAHLNAPTALREAANQMERLEASGYALYDRSIDDAVVTWFFRKPKPQNHEAEKIQQ